MVRPKSQNDRRRRALMAAVALATSPRVLLADEPTGLVDAATEERVLDLLGRQRAAGTAILIATHS
jgi:putative ABC transport system ATP-binding protein